MVDIKDLRPVFLRLLPSFQEHGKFQRILYIMSFLFIIIIIKKKWIDYLTNTQNTVSKLPKQRAELQKELRAIVKKYGPELGSLYYDQDVQWENYLSKSKSINQDGEYEKNNLNETVLKNKNI